MPLARCVDKQAEELGTMSKNNVRGITLARGPIWGIHSLTLIISWFAVVLSGLVCFGINKFMCFH